MRNLSRLYQFVFHSGLLASLALLDVDSSLELNQGNTWCVLGCFLFGLFSC